MLAAFANGADAILAVSEIEEALTALKHSPKALLAGERNGVRIGAELTGGIEFDLGNSPREMTEAKVRGKTLITTTTNGTRAIRAGAGAEHLLISSFGNLSATADRIVELRANDVVLISSGTGENACLEDICGVGALVQKLVQKDDSIKLEDSARVAQHVFSSVSNALKDEVGKASNAQRLMSIPALAGDVEWCLQTDQFSIVPWLNSEGYLTCS